MSWRWTDEHELLGQVRIRMVAMRRPRGRTARGDASTTFGRVESIDDVARGRVGTAIRYRRVIAELLAIAAAQHPGRFRPQLGHGDPLGHLRAGLASEPPAGGSPSPTSD